MGRDTGCSDWVSERYLHVNNCGYYRDISFDMKLRRGEGRHDFQYIYIDKGAGEFEIDGRNIRVEAGSVVIYKPHEKQVYSFEKRSGSDFYWIHFSGTAAEEILKELGLYGGVYRTGEMFRVREAVKKAVSVLDSGEKSAEIRAAGLLTEVLAETAENVYPIERKMKKVIETMQKEGMSGRKNADYARMCGMSEYHFIRRFKEETGTTPHRYRIKLVIEKAADLLTKTDINISEAAWALGFDDALYFSRVFRKETGKSPAEFRAENSGRNF